MNKKCLLLIGLFSLSVAKALSQTNVDKRYDATYSTGAVYQTLSTSATEIIFQDPDWDDEFSNPINLSFPFKYQNTTVNNVIVETYGSLLLNGLIEEDWGLGTITGINMDYMANGRGKVLYEITGSVGNRIFKVEYRNVSRYFDDLNVDTLNFQIWLHESDNAIEYRAGYSNVDDTIFASSFQDLVNGGKEALMVGLIANNGDSISTLPEFMGLHSTKLTANVFSDSVLNYEMFLNQDEPVVNSVLFGAYPPEGSIIRFVPKSTLNIGKIDFNLATIYPNPSKSGIFNLQLKENLKNASIVIYDLSGRVVQTQTVSNIESTINLSSFPAGQYIGKIISEAKTGVFKLIKE